MTLHRRALAAPLLAWFSSARRDLPWRREPRDPYRVWVSEVMLQQTRVDVVVPYFERFVLRFPTLRALAAAPLDDVLALWSGLGYYARGRNLHRAAQEASSRFGALPRTLDELRSLPGFGPYTSAAVASLAFGLDAPLVDGNVARVLSRLFALPGDPDEARARAWALAPSLLPAGRAGPFNEALMELGATICTPRSPACARCPLAESCEAFAQGDPERFPGPKVRKARPVLRWAAVALCDAQGRVLLARHDQGSLFEGLWGLPFAPFHDSSGALAAARNALRTRALAIPRGLAPAGEVHQTLTHRELHVSLFSATARAAVHARATPETARWLAPTAAALRTLGLSSLAKKCLAACGIPAAPRTRTPAPRPTRATPRRPRATSSPGLPSRSRRP